MKTQFGTPVPSIIIHDAHSPKQKDIVNKCINCGCAVTLYADHLTEDLKLFSKLSFVQLRIGKMNFPVVDNGKFIVVDAQLSDLVKQTLYLEHMITN